MHALTRLPAALILTDRIVDDAGVFPPEELDVASALARHRSDQAISNPVLSQRFVCSAGRFDELHRHLDDGDRIQVIALGPAVQQTEASVVSLEADDRTPVVALETSLPVDNQHKVQALEVIDQNAAAPPHLDIFVEVGLGPALEADLDLLQRHGHAAKVRCGGVRRELFPLPSDLARFVHHAIGREVPFKATAALHHAIAHPDVYTGFDHFGFLNLLLAVAAAQKGAGTNEVEHILVECDPNVVLERITGLTTRDACEIRAAFNSEGGCSTSEPIDDLRRASASSPTPPNSEDPRQRRTS
jgi:hypothetical protein